MASFFNLFSCFSEPPSSKRYVCNGDVCTLSDTRYLAKKDKLSLPFSLSCLSTRKGPLRVGNTSC
ncbi:hypothetical protein SOVF_199830 [Spinacia oleracea]|nr:hypothetical protein SOVF_199830 [Spinacia oleracea]